LTEKHLLQLLRLQDPEKKKRVDIKMKLVYNLPKPRNFVAKDLRTPKYRLRTVESKVKYTRQPKHRKADHGLGI
jgi:hypothetical protein